LKSIGLVTAQNKKEFNTIVRESLSKLHPDLSNREEVVQEIISKTRKLRRREFDNKNSHRKVTLDDSDYRIPKSFLEGIEEGSFEEEEAKDDFYN